MALTIPNEVSATFAPQAAVDSTDIATIVAGVGATGVLTGCAVTAPGSSGMTVAVAAGTVLIGNVTVTVNAVTGLAIGVAGASDRKDMIVVNNAGTVSVAVGGSSGAVAGVTPAGSRDPVKGSIPATSVVLAEVYVATTTAALTTAANVTDMRMFVPGSGGLTIPSGQTMITGTRSVYTGTRATTTNASDTVDLGTLATTGGAMEVRLHSHLITSAVSLTKVYELAMSSSMGFGATVTNITNVSTAVTVTVGSTTGLSTGMIVTISGATGMTNVNGTWTITLTSSTQFTFTATIAPTGTYTASSAWAAAWYVALPADTSANSASTNDFALEVARTATATFTMRFRQKSIANTGVITWTAETLGDTVVTFTASTTITSAPTAVSTIHPSNAFIAAAGNVGIDTEAPTVSLTVAGSGLQVQRTDGANGAIVVIGATGSAAAEVGISNAALGNTLWLGSITTAGTLVSDSAANDSVLMGSTGTLRVGVGSGASILRLTSSDVSIDDNGTARSIPRSKVSPAVVINHITTMTTTETAVTDATDISVTIVAGRRYRVSVCVPVLSSVANDAINLKIRDGGGSAPTNASTLLPGGMKQFAGPTTSANNACYFFEIAPNALTAGTHRLGLFGLRAAGSGTLSIGQTAAGWEGTVTVDDIGT